MNLRLILLVIGLIVGGLVGWTTAPDTSTLKVGPLSVEVQGGNSGDAAVTATDNNGQVKLQVGSTSPLDNRNTRTLIFAVIGAVIGGVAGMLAGNRRRT